tara:strand:+ start:125 stop:724 length:600 start_codon:yes stop_codon:yes gene_type:complete
MFVNQKLAVLFLLSLSISGGCSTSVQQSAFPNISFAHLPPIGLNVARIEVENRYVTPATKPHIEHKLPISLAATASNWGRDRLRAQGKWGVVRVIIRRASFVEVPLKRSPGLKGVFTRDQSQRYDAVIDILIELRDVSGKVRVTAESVASRSRSVSEEISLTETEKIWFQMIEELMFDLNNSLVRQINRHMREWLKTQF